MSEEVRALLKEAREKARAAKALFGGEEPDTEQGMALLGQAEKLRERAEAMKRAQTIVDAVGEPQLPAALPTEPEAGELPGPQVSTDAAVKAAINDFRFGSVDDPTSLIMREIYSGDWRQLAWEQERAFAKYFRFGKGDPILRRQIWGPEYVKDMLVKGVTVAEIKATMVEGADELGGYAVPPQRTAGILSRIKGLTAVRAAGATVLQTASNMITWLKLTGGGDRYPTAMRGLWGTEVQSPTEDDFTLGEELVPVHTYTYKVPFSQSLLEDWTNVGEVFDELVSDTLAMDEDDVFLIGDGSGKPRGLLPSSANSDSIGETNSGNASTLDVATVKGLRRGIASQYRAGNRACWVLNSSTADTVEQFQDGSGRFYYQYLDSGERFLRHRVFESEAMPDIAANAYPILFGDFSGYFIVERLGLSVVRFQDSNTGINKVEFHIRRRIGGKMLQSWKFAVQKVAV